MPSAASRSIARTAHIATVMAGIRNTHAAPPRQKEAILPEDLIAMLEDARPRHAARPARPRHAADRLCRRPAPLRNRRPRPRPRPDRGRSRLDRNPRQGHAGDAARQDRLARGRDRPRLVRRHLPGRGAQTWLKFARIATGPLFRRVTGQGKDVGAERLNDQEVARLVKRAALAAGVRGDLAEASAHSNSPAIRCAPASPPRPRSTSAMCKSSSAMPRRNDPQIPAPARPVPGQSHQGIRACTHSTCHPRRRPVGFQRRHQHWTDRKRPCPRLSCQGPQIAAR
jgi:hypothetical protein